MAASKRVLTGTEEGARIEAALRVMEADIAHNTEAGYSSNIEAYPDNSIPFVRKHMAYLDNHPKVDPDQYLSNLRLMTKIRSRR